MSSNITVAYILVLLSFPSQSVILFRSCVILYFLGESALCTLSAPAQGKPGGVNQSAADAEAEQVQWGSKCFVLGLYLAYQ